MREALPNIAIQMLLRGRNTVGYTPYPTEVTDAFVREAASTGVDIFRIFDALNDVDQMRPAIDAVLATGTAVAEVALCYTGDLLDPAEDLYTLDYYLRLAEQIVDGGRAHPRDQGHGGPAARRRRREARHRAARALRPAGARAHARHRRRPAGDAAGREPCRCGRGGRRERTDGRHDEPAVSLSALVAALAHTERDTGLGLQAVSDLEPYWEAVRKVYRPFESGLPGPTGRVYQHEIPGGQLSNLRQQAIALGLGDQFEVIEDLYAAASRILGRPPKVTPSSKVVGDLALALAAADADPADFEENPREVRHPRLGRRLHGGRARRSARRMAGAVPHQGAQGPRRQDRRRGADPG